MPTEADICRAHITPKLQAAGWKSDPHPIPEQRRILSEVDAVKRLQDETAAELDALLLADLNRVFKGRFGVIDRAWTSSPPARSVFTLPLCESRLARFQRARLKGEL